MVPNSLPALAELSAALLSLPTIVNQIVIYVASLMPTALLITGPTAEGIWTRIVLKNKPAMQEMRVPSLGWEDPLEKEWQPTPVFLPGKFHIQRSLEGYSPKGCKESDTTERRTQQHNTVFHHSTELQTLSLLLFFFKPFFFLNCVFSEHQD